MNKKLFISLVVGVLVSAVTLYYAFKNVPFADLANYLRSVDYWVIGPASAAIAAAFVFRAFRWKAILGPEQHVSFKEAFHPLMIGFMLNCVYPGRIGELGRPMILKAKSKVPFSTGLATVGVERLLDLIFLILLFGLVLNDIDFRSERQVLFAGYRIDHTVILGVGKGMIALGTAIIVGIVLISMNASRSVIKRFLKAVPRWIFFLNFSQKEKFFEKIISRLLLFIDNIASGFALVKSPRRIIVCFAYSSLVWLFTIFSYFIVAKGSPGIDLSAAEITAVMVIICFAIALPSAPGYWGLWEAGGVFALSFFSIEQKDAVGFTLVNHAIQILPIIVIGIICSWMTGIKLKSVSSQLESKDDRGKLSGKPVKKNTRRQRVG